MNYTTDFSAFAPQDPISEAGRWTNTVTSVWNTTVSTAVSPVRAIGLLGVSANDSVSKMTGTWGPDQVVSGTMLVTGNGGTSGAELELHCRMTMIPGSPDNIFTYEFDFIASGTNRCDIVRWDGTQGTFVLLSSVTLSANLVTGDIIKVSAIGPKGAVVLSVFLNGVLQGSFTDTDAANSLASGQPGIGFDNENLLVGSDLFALKGFTATDGLGGAVPVGGFINPVLLW